MKAVVLTESRRLELQDMKTPEPGPGEVLLKPEYCGICGTDLHAAEIEMFNPPVVLGHEFSGTPFDSSVPPRNRLPLLR